MDKDQKKTLLKLDSSWWKYFLVALVIISIAYFIGNAFFEIFPAMEKQF